MCEPSSSSAKDDTSVLSAELSVAAPQVVADHAGAKTCEGPVPRVAGNVKLSSIPTPRFLLREVVRMVPKRHPNTRASSLTSVSLRNILFLISYPILVTDTPRI